MEKKKPTSGIGVAVIHIGFAEKYKSWDYPLNLLFEYALQAVYQCIIQVQEWVIQPLCEMQVTSQTSEEDKSVAFICHEFV